MGLVVGHRLRGAARAVDPEELCQFRMAGCEGIRRVDDVPGGGDRSQQRLDLPDDPLDRGRAGTRRRLAAVAEDGASWVFLISSIRSVASAALTLPSATCPARSWRAWTRWTTAGLPILARCPLISWDSIGADSPRTAARRAWFRPRSSMSRRNSAPSGSPYQLRCSSLALAVASCCTASTLTTPLRWCEPREHLTERGRGAGVPIILRDAGVHRVLCAAERPLPHGVRSRPVARGLSSVGRALPLQGRCQEFESPRLHIQRPPDQRKRRSGGLLRYGPQAVLGRRRRVAVTAPAVSRRVAPRAKARW